MIVKQEATLLNVLASIRRRYLLRGLISSLSVSITIALIGTVFVSSYPNFQFNLISELELGLSLGLLIFSISYAVTFLRSPTLVVISRQLDQHYELCERFSTAIEIITSPREVTINNMIAEALLKDAQSHAELISIKTYTPLFPLRLKILIILCLIAISISAFLPIRERRVRNAFEQLAQSQSIMPHLEELAEMIDKDSLERKDPYLGAIARSLSELSANQTHSAQSLADTSTKFTTILEHAARAYSERPPQWLAATSTSATELKKELQQFAEQGPLAFSQPLHLAEKNNKDQNTSQTGAISSSKTQTAFDPSRRNFPEGLSSGQADSEIDGQSETQFSNGDYQLSPADQIKLDRERQINEKLHIKPPEYGQPVGGAQEAGKGGNLAGEGVQTNNQAETQAILQRNQISLNLPIMEKTNGRTIRLEVLPETQSNTSSAKELGSSPLLSIKQTEISTPMSLMREYIPLYRRDLSRLYFQQDDKADNCMINCLNGIAK